MVFMKPLLLLIGLITGFTFSIGQAQTLTTIESVEYDSANNRYLISNATNIIAQSATDGKLTVFGNGPKADLGMEILKGVLYAVVGRNVVKGYDLTTGSQVFTTTVADGQWFNGMTTDGDSLIWVTDSFGDKIIQINVNNKQTPKITKFAIDTAGKSNGIYYEKEKKRLVWVNWGDKMKINTWDLVALKEGVAKNTEINNCDGLVRDRIGNWYVSCQDPNSGVFKFAPDFSGNAIPVEGTYSNPADMSYNSKEDIIAVPNTKPISISLIKLNNASVSVFHKSNGKVDLRGHRKISDAKYLGNQVLTVIDGNLYNLGGQKLPAKTLVE
jgi:hypothetical protein